MADRYAHYSDEDLFRLMGEGRKDAFAEIYTRYRGRIYAYVLRMIGDRDRADDIFQETFTRIYRHCHEKDHDIARASSYIFTTARNRCLNAIRDRKTTTDVEDYHQIVYQPSYENAELSELVKTSLELLPDHYREAFVLREYDGLSYHEISEITGESLASVKIHIFRAKKKLREILMPYLEEA
ncbi:MAG: RNA polymerase sigma factor [Ignavibacteriae bacterium]|nr:RNA polymerase sigma factor [Ignavibacteriota bacterium]MCB9217687.1 RNA polymerase sigma factor [Ignavibacteria bacterium]